MQIMMFWENSVKAIHEPHDIYYFTNRIYFMSHQMYLSESDSQNSHQLAYTHLSLN